MSQIDRLIEGLKILRKYAPEAFIYGMTRNSGSIETQEEEFGRISDHDRTLLLSLGWTTNEYYVWKF